MNETIRTLKSRVSCKCYDGRHIDSALLEQIVAAGLNAPSGLNKQTPLFAVVTDDAAVATLSALNAAVLGASTDPFYGAKDVIVVLARKEGTWLYDGSLAMGNLLNAAHSLGIGACWIHRAKEVFESDQGQALLRQWGISGDVEGIGFCVLGHSKKAKEDPQIQPGRVFRIGGK